MRQLKIYKSITKRDTESISSYFAEVSQIPLLTEKQEYNLFQQVAEGNDQALQTVIKSNLRFVISVAKQYQNKGVSLEDLINDGNFGLIKAAKKFDKRGVLAL
jgi:RNA polymerase primary sigma factor